MEVATSYFSYSVVIVLVGVQQRKTGKLVVDLSGQQDVRSGGKRKNSRINNLLTALLVVIVWPGGL